MTAQETQVRTARHMKPCYLTAAETGPRISTTDPMLSKLKGKLEKLSGDSIRTSPVGLIFEPGMPAPARRRPPGSGSGRMECRDIGAHSI
jgi:hypothetical protein